jgi:drug/metabolite transporter (DMT)-like permease
MRESPKKNEIPPRWQVVMAFAAVYLIWGSTYLGIHLAVESIPPFSMAGSRALVAGALLYVWARGRGATRPERIHWREAAIVGGFLLLGGNGLVSWAEQTLPSGVTALIVGSIPLWMVLLEWLWHSGPRPTVGTVSGLVVGFVGVGLLVAPAKLGSGERANSSTALVLLLGPLFWAIGSLYSRRARLPSSQLLGAAMEMLAGGALLMVAGAAFGEWKHFEFARVSTHSAIAWIYLTLFGSLVAFTAYVWLLKASTPARVSTYAYVNPVVAVFLGWAVIHEPITLRTMLAALAIIIAVVIIVTRSREVPAET